MAFGDFASATGELSSEEQDIVDTLTRYGVDILEHVDPSELPHLTKRNPLNPATIACRVLSALFSQQVLSRDTAPYTEWRSQFWSQQQSEVQPACIFQPLSSAQVAIALLTSCLVRCPFAVKSGGHAAFAGSSSIPDGLTIDMGRLNTVNLSSDKKSAIVGAGNRWFDVYSQLSPEGVTVVGGRVSNIGVGGLTLGGGISLYSAQYGFACDNVNSYEVVVADGRILNVSLQSHPDLYWALRGGGNNFGIVTKFDLEVYPAGNLWAGSRIYLLNDNVKSSILNAVVRFGNEWPSDRKAAFICNFAFAQGIIAAAINLGYTEPVENPPIFNSFREIPELSNNLAIKTLPELTEEFRQSNPNGLRENYWTLTVKLDIEMLTFVVDSFMAGVDPIRNVAGILPALTLQIFTSDMIQKMAKNGGNALGLEPSEGPLLLVLVNVMWSNKADDKAVLKAVSDIINTIKTEAQSSGKLNKYIYMNYASQFQAVVESYGAVNHHRLLDVARRYDPFRVFQRLQPGYFKLNGAPDPKPPPN
ncbi:hypothetical protein ACO22_05682 [Paracoccidioides brasiliensis]|uniref:FAD-binding PCMH-type domain-containing protein n=1 Tax=Paracoccidioides brasiliensis TaxID=121759 RepID=A0A1D2J9Q8_PARBR|nr:hypothetical protein ACO22_05682 [Paracoccidioides brasiliensis]